VVWALFTWELIIYNKVHLPWVQLTWQAFYSRPTPLHHRKHVGFFWWRDVMSISDNFFMMVECSTNEVNTIYFWRDTWNAGVLQWKYPQLYFFDLNKNISAKSFMNGDIHRHFWRPLSIEGSTQLVELQQLLAQVLRNADEPGRWKYIWNFVEFSTHKAYL
jgi:hypothetical protein